MNIVLQEGNKDCGVSCLLSIINYYKSDVPKEYLRELTNTTKTGVTAYNLIEAAKLLGFDANGVTGEIEHIKQKDLPCIAHIILNKKFTHFIVIYNIDIEKNKITIMDPSCGKKTISVGEFKLLTTTNYIFLKPKKKLVNISNKKIIKKELILFIKKYKLTIFYICILTILYFIFNIITAFQFKFFLEFTINFKSTTNLYKITVTLIIIYLMSETLKLIRNILLLKISSIFDYVITTKVFEQIILLPYLYYKNRTTGEIISRIKELSIIKNFISKSILILLTDTLCFFVALYLLLNISKSLTIVVITFLTIIFIYTILIKKKKQNILKKYYKKEDEINNYLLENLVSVEVIKGMHIEKSSTDNFKLKYDDLVNNLYKVSKFSEQNTFIKQSLINIMTILILSIGSNYVINGIITLAELIVFNSIIFYYLTSFNNLIYLFENYIDYKIIKKRIEELFILINDNFKGNSFYRLFSLNKDIEFINLTYKYTSKTLYNNINLKIKGGEKIVVSGKSGTGKSTLFKLLSRYLEIDYGMIKINNCDINHFHLDNLRTKITYVSQLEFLYTDTIINNITLKKEKLDKEVNKIIKLTQVEEIVKRDKLGLNQMIEENGFNLSGGERQRIILARSLLKNSDIYIFDEALNQVEVEKEREILIKLFKYLSKKTIIIISHRLDNKDLFDRSIILENGKLIEEEI